MIVLAAIALFIAIVAAITEYRDVSAYVWDEKFDFEDKEPQGLYIFKELIDRYFEDVPLVINSEIEDSVGRNDLYIQFVPTDMDDSFVDTLISIAEAGNDILIIGDYYHNRLTDTMPYTFEQTYRFDSMLHFNFTQDELASDTSYIYKYQDRLFKKNLERTYYVLRSEYWEESQNYVRVASSDSLALMVSFDVGEGRLFQHMTKELFYNYSYHQPQMFDYTQSVFAHFDPNRIHLLNPLTIYGAGNFRNKNPLEFIMSQPALKVAYYLLILGTLLYVFFGGRRKQKIIPVMDKNENTSLEYIETVSQLFYQQDQHEKLVAHMKNIFYHKMQKKFYVAPDDPNYVQVLSKKSKISTTELQYILHRFNEQEKNYRFTSEQLVSLNQRLERIYKEIEK